MRDPAFWRGKRVLLTGHTGFKGGWAALMLQEMGAEVTGLALAPEPMPCLFDKAEVGSSLQSIIGDIRDAETVDRALATSRAEIVLHCAAQAIVRDGYKDPVATYATNVMGTVHVLDAIRRSKHVRAALVVTSDKCYENREWLWPYRENEPMGGHDPYSSSKGCAELVVAAYRQSYLAEAGIGLASARAGNVIGGGDWSKARLVPDLIRGLSAGEPILIRQPDAIRPWQHVMDALLGYFQLVEKLWHDPKVFAQGWNFGPDDASAMTVRAIADLLVREWGDGAAWQQDEQAGPHEAQMLRLDSSRARALLGWQPAYGVEQAITSIVEWHKADLAGETMLNVTRAQIKAHKACGAIS